MLVRTLLAGVCALACALLSSLAEAQDWPARAVKLVVPSSPGGGTDVYGRLLAQGLSEVLSQQFIVENRPGASGNIGAEAVAKAAPDGHTFLVSANASIAIGPSLYKKLPFDADRDFAPIARGVTSALVLVVHPSIGAKSLGDLVAIAKREPGKLAFGSAGTGTPTFLGMRMLEEAAGIRLLHVPYKGVGMAFQGFLGQQIQLLLPDLASALPQIKAGKAVAIALNEKSSLLPGTPTFAEAGLPAVEVIGSFSVLAPAGTPVAIQQRMSEALMKVMRTPALAEKLTAQGLNPVFDTPSEFTASLRRERATWAAFIQRNNIVAED